jgi:hypothetical protein
VQGSIISIFFSALCGQDYRNNHLSRVSFSELETGDYSIILG